MRDLKGPWKVVASLLIGYWAGLIIYVALGWGLFHPVLRGSVFLSFGLALVFLLYPLGKKEFSQKTSSFWNYFLFGKKDSPALLDILLIIISVIPCVYVMLNWERFLWRPGCYETRDLIFGVVLIICLIEGTRRSLGKAIPILVISFIGYALFGEFIPGFFGHGGFTLEEVLYQLYLMTEGFWGLLLDITGRVIAVFIIFGLILFAIGASKSFMDIAKFFGGRLSGGAGEIAVISSAAVGSISGSAVANVATTGVLTIPTMKRMGYKSELAGAVEAAASTGGQIMPPIMGAGAFIIAEVIGIAYLSVMVAAIIPAIIYFFGVGIGVYIWAKKYGLGKLSPELIPKLSEVFAPRRIMMVLVPIGVLICLLILYLPPQLCCVYALITGMAMFIMVGSCSLKAIWERIKIIAHAYYRAIGGTLAWLVVMMTCVQAAVTMISLTGFGVKISTVIIALSGGSVFIALIATMVCAIILGMGMTTTAAYVIAAAVLAPVLIGMGFDPLAGHLFIFYFAILSAITPPVCIAVFAASAISGGKWTRIALTAMSLGVGGYIIPFYFIFNPALLMLGEPLTILIHAVTALSGTALIACGVLGYFIKPSTLLERVLFIASGLMLMHGALLTDGIGFALAAGGFLSQRFMPAIPVIGTRATSFSTSEGEHK